jgi:uncharacterized protein YndB with AHSA1/START domain
MTDVRQQISAVRRTLGTRTLEAGEARVSTISQVYDTDQDDLWEAVTNPERVARWFLPLEGELKEGGHYQLTGNAGGTITRCDRPRGYAATWEFGEMVSWIEVRLTPAGEGRTRFELEHVAHVDDDLWDQYGPGATGLGWDSALWGLVQHVADPAVTPVPADVLAWLTSDEGKALLRGSADSWAAAEVAAGAESSVAQHHADTSYAAYTGGA